VDSIGAEVGATVFDGVWEGENAVTEGVNVRLGVHDGGIDVEVKEGVKDGVNVAG
jgi:hypothetical protein